MGAQASIFSIKQKLRVVSHANFCILSNFFQFFPVFPNFSSSFYQKWYILPARHPEFSIYGRSCAQAANSRRRQILWRLQICGSCEFPQLENFTRSGNFWKLQTLNFSQIFAILYIESEREKKLLQIKPSNWVATL